MCVVRAEPSGQALDHLRTLIRGRDYQALLPHLTDSNKEALFEEVDVQCSLIDEVDVVRCFRPETLYIGEPPLLSSRIFERWHGETWADHGEL